jgi:methylenetetrahydrofolate dehydrogenase (NADP+)/methenyltetrahydrofolate cyclohydrolase
MYNYKDIHRSLLIEQISPLKDIDGITSSSMGNLALGSRHHSTELQRFFFPCTPLGIMELLEKSNISLRGKHVVVLGRSIIVGLPVGLMSLHRDATVAYCHSKCAEENVLEIVRKGDIVISAVGKPNLVRSNKIVLEIPWQHCSSR